MKDRVELFVPELLLPIECGQILRHEIAAITAQILKIAGAEIVDHGQSGLGKFFLEREREIGADESGATGNEEIRRRCGHGGHYSAADEICLEPRNANG